MNTELSLRALSAVEGEAKQSPDMRGDCFAGLRLRSSTSSGLRSATARNNRWLRVTPLCAVTRETFLVSTLCVETQAEEQAEAIW